MTKTDNVVEKVTGSVESDSNISRMLGFDTSTPIVSSILSDDHRRNASIRNQRLVTIDAANKSVTK